MATEWTSIAQIGTACKGRFIRTRCALALRDNNAVINHPTAPRKVTLPKGAIGYCYAASGVIHVGFTEDFGQREFANPVNYRYVVAFNARDIPVLEIQK
jgi:hypothetical protein